MTMWEGINKRKFPRVAYKCQIRISGGGKERVYDTHTDNIGGGGICLTLGKKIDLFQNVEMVLYLGGGEAPVSCKGTVVWAVRKQNDKKSGAYEHDTGIEFTDISAEDSARIAAMVDNILMSRLDNEKSP